MAVTLEAARQNAVDATELAIIDEYRKSHLLDLMTFIEAVNPVGGGQTLTYSYRRETALGTAQFRPYNTEYPAEELSPTTRHSVDLVVLGGAFEVDRILGNNGPTQTNEIARNLRAKIEATRAKFAETVINGDSGQDANSFDGLAKALAGTSTEVVDEADWSGTTNEDGAFAIMENLDEFLANLSGTPTALISNRRVLAKIKAAARRANVYTQAAGPLGSMRDFYDTIALIDAGPKSGTNEDIIPVVDGVAPLYAVKLGEGDFTGITTTGGQFLKTWLPDFSTAGAVKRGEVEMGPVAVALKTTKSAGVLKNVRLAPSGI